MATDKRKPYGYVKIPVDSFSNENLSLPVRIHLYYLWNAPETGDYHDYSRWETLAQVLGFEIPKDMKKRESLRDKIRRARDRAVEQGLLAKTRVPEGTFSDQFQGVIPEASPLSMEAMNKAHGKAIRWVPCRQEAHEQAIHGGDVLALKVDAIPEFLLSTQEDTHMHDVTIGMRDRLPDLMDLDQPKVLSFWTTTFPQWIEAHPFLSAAYEEGVVRNTMALAALVLRAKDRNIFGNRFDHGDGGKVGIGILKGLLDDVDTGKKGAHLIRSLGPIKAEVDSILSGESGIRTQSIQDLGLTTLRDNRKKTKGAA